MRETIGQILLALARESNKVIIDKCSIYSQTWPSTALGFNGVGGDMLTTALTTAIETDRRIFVFFGNALAYTKTVHDLPEGLYERIFDLHDAPSVSEFLQLVSSTLKDPRN